MRKSPDVAGEPAAPWGVVRYVKGKPGNWQRAIWKLVTNPAIEMVATILVVMVATWYVVDTQVSYPERGVPVPFGRR